jgi:hypothetical protein
MELSPGNGVPMTQKQPNIPIGMQNTNIHLVKADNGRIGVLCRPDTRSWCVDYLGIDQIHSKIVWGTGFLMGGLNHSQPNEPPSRSGGKFGIVSSQPPAGAVQQFIPMNFLPRSRTIVQSISNMLFLGINLHFCSPIRMTRRGFSCERNYQKE